MQEISRDLRRLSERLERAARRAPEMRRALHDRLGTRLLDEVRARTPISENGHALGHGQYHARGTLRRWQTKYIGTGGGYAAVRAASTPRGRSGAGAVTNYVENGHRVYYARIAPSARTRRRHRRQARPTRTFVDGRGFYHATESRAAALLTREAERFAAELTREITG